MFPNLAEQIVHFVEFTVDGWMDDALKRRNGVEGVTSPTAAQRRRWRCQKHSEKHTPYSPAKPLSHWSRLDPRSRSFLLVFGCLLLSLCFLIILLCMFCKDHPCILYREPFLSPIAIIY
jgi:hypothetical protein